MKMTDAHYTILEQKFDALAAELEAKQVSFQSCADEYQEAGVSSRRFRFDALHASKLRAGNAHNDSPWPVYDYLNDDHIDTAMRQYFRTRHIEFGAQQ